jgi:hypothetical protein
MTHYTAAVDIQQVLHLSCFQKAELRRHDGGVSLNNPAFGLKTTQL